LTVQLLEAQLDSGDLRLDVGLGSAICSKPGKVLQALRDPVSIPRRQLSSKERGAAIAIINNRPAFSPPAGE
jgi:hypothetical protein